MYFFLFREEEKGFLFVVCITSFVLVSDVPVVEEGVSLAASGSPVPLWTPHTHMHMVPLTGAIDGCRGTTGEDLHYPQVQIQSQMSLVTPCL